jgi:single-strand DNA-binding protein
MSRGVNMVTLLGNVGNAPETKVTPSGMSITTISLATSYKRKDGAGNSVEKTEWHRVKFFGKVAEIAQKFLRKGSKCMVIGRIEYGSYDKDNVKHYTTDIIADDLNLLSAAVEGHGA